MNYNRNCTICLSDLNTNHQIESIFSIDSKANTCLAYKIFQMTGIQMIQQKVGEFLCEDCHDMLITIVQLEKEFAKKFHMLDNNVISKTKDIADRPPNDHASSLQEDIRTIKEEIHSPEGLNTPEQNLEDAFEDRKDEDEDLQETNIGLEETNNGLEVVNRDLEEYKRQQNPDRFLNHQNPMEQCEVQHAGHTSEGEIENTEAEEEHKNDLSRKRKGEPVKRQFKKLKKEKTSVEPSALFAELSEGVVTYKTVTINNDQTNADETISIENLKTYEDETSFDQTKKRPYRKHDPELKALNRSRIEKKLEFQQLINNLKKIDADGKEYWQCDSCEKDFARRDGLITHRRRFHTGERPHVCQECGKGFADKSNYNRHVKFHSGIKPYKCENCPKAFITKQHLKNHLVNCIPC